MNGERPSVRGMLARLGAHSTLFERRSRSDTSQMDVCLSRATVSAWLRVTHQHGVRASSPLCHCLAMQIGADVLRVRCLSRSSRRHQLPSREAEATMWRPATLISATCTATDGEANAGQPRLVLTVPGSPRRTFCRRRTSGSWPNA